MFTLFEPPIYSSWARWGMCVIGVTIYIITEAYIVADISYKWYEILLIACFYKWQHCGINI